MKMIKAPYSCELIFHVGGKIRQKKISLEPLAGHKNAIGLFHHKKKKNSFTAWQKDSVFSP